MALNKKGRTITFVLNPLLEELSRLNGNTVKQNLVMLNIPQGSRSCASKQQSGYISRVKQEVRKHENKANKGYHKDLGCDVPVYGPLKAALAKGRAQC